MMTRRQRAAVSGLRVRRLTNCVCMTVIIVPRTRRIIAFENELLTQEKAHEIVRMPSVYDTIRWASWGKGNELKGIFQATEWVLAGEKPDTILVDCMGCGYLYSPTKPTGVERISRYEMGLSPYRSLIRRRPEIVPESERESA